MKDNPDKTTVSDAKHAKFLELAGSRTNKALDAIERIGKLSNRQLYEWEQTEIKKIIKALREAVAEVESRFASTKGKTGAKFSF